MATRTDRSYCTTCGKERVTYTCVGCSQEFCFDDLTNHRQSLVKQLNDLEDERNLFRQILTEKLTNPKESSLMQQINQWENDSIKTIERTAEDARQLLLKHTNETGKKIEFELGKLTEELKRIRQENDFNEIHLDRFRQKLDRLEEQLQNPSNISIQQDNSSLFVNKISILFVEQSFVPNIDINAKWIQNGMTVAGGNGHGSALNQFSKPVGFYIGDDQTIYVADRDNHRIVEWKKDATVGQVVAGGKGAGNRNDQLNGPRNVILDKQNQSLIICDRVMRWSKAQQISIVTGGNAQGEERNQLHHPTGLSFDRQNNLYVADCSNHRIQKFTIEPKTNS